MTVFDSNMNEVNAAFILCNYFFSATHLCRMMIVNKNSENIYVEPHNFAAAQVSIPHLSY